VRKLSETLARIAASPEYRKFLKDQFAFDNSFIDAAKATQFVKEQLDDMKKATAAN
jgi:tripartite-type tricarboxylate transporter receptor subunit TctC